MAWKRVKDVNSIVGDLVKLKSANGPSSIISKFQAMRYAIEASMDLYIEDNDGIPTAEMRRPAQKRSRTKAR